MVCFPGICACAAQTITITKHCLLLFWSGPHRQKLLVNKPWIDLSKEIFISVYILLSGTLCLIKQVYNIFFMCHLMA